jgi:hypothetical protein
MSAVVSPLHALVLLLALVAHVSSRPHSSGKQAKASVGAGAQQVSISQATLLLPINQKGRVEFVLEGYNGCFMWYVFSKNRLLLLS